MVQLYANNQTGIANSPEVTVIRPVANLNIQCDNIVNPPNGEFIFSTYRTMSDGNGGQIVDPSSICEMTGTSSGNIITITSFAPGNTDTGNQVGDRVVFRPGAHWANTVAKRLDETGDWAVNQDKLAATVADITSENNWILPNTGIITQSSGLIGTFSNINYYINGKKYSKTSIANKTYTATKDTYVFINASGTVTYTEVTVGAAAPATPANSVLVAVVTTNASAITNITLPNHAPITASKIDFTTFPRFFAYATGVQTNITTTTIVFGATKYNIGNAFNTSNSRFTAPVAGTYHFSATIAWQSVSAQTVWGNFYVNGSNYTPNLRFSRLENQTGNPYCSGSVEIYLNSGDYVTVVGTIVGTARSTESALSCFGGHLVALG